MMIEAEKAIYETRQLLKLKKDRLLKNYGSPSENVRDSLTFVENLVAAQEDGTTILDYEKWHVDANRKENFSLFSQQPTEARKVIAQVQQQ